MAPKDGLTGRFLKIVFSICLILLSVIVGIARAAIKPAILRSESSFAFLLRWTAPGDDGYIGQAYLYDLRYSVNPVGRDTTAWWQSATPITGTSRPSLSGRADSCVITGLVAGQSYYCAIKTADERLNWSKISNIAIIKYFPCADINGDGTLNLLDVVYLMNFLYKDGPALIPGSGDVNASGRIDILDVDYLVKYFYRAGGSPICVQISGPSGPNDNFRHPSSYELRSPFDLRWTGVV